MAGKRLRYPILKPRLLLRLQGRIARARTGIVPPCHAQSMQDESVAFGEGGGVNDRFVSVEDRLVSRETPRFVAHNALTVLASRVCAVPVAVLPCGRLMCRHRSSWP